MNPTMIVLLLALAPCAEPADPPLPEGAIARLGSPQWRALGENRFPPAFSADGHTIVTQDWDVVRAVDFETGAVRWELSGFHGDANVVFLPDGRMVIVDANTIRVHDLATGKEQRRVACVFQPYQYVASNGTLVAMQVSSGPKYNATVVLDLAADTKPWHYGGLNDPAGTCSPVGFVAGSRELVLRAYRNRETWICVIDPGAQKLVREWKLPAMPQVGYSNPVALSPDGKLLLSGGEKSVRLWNVATGKERSAWNGHADEVIQAAFSADGKRLLTAGKDRTLRWWDLDTGKELGKIDNGKNAYALAVSSNGKRAAAICGGENTLRRFDLEAGREYPLADGHTNLIEQVAFLPDSKRLLTASLDGTVHVWDVDSRRTIRTWKPEHRTLAWLAVSPDGKSALTAGYNDPAVRLWDIATGTEARSVTHPGRGVGAVAFAPNGKTFLSGSFADADDQQNIRAWETATGKESGKWPGNPGGVGSMAFLPDGQRLITTISDMGIRMTIRNRAAGSAQVWDIAAAKALPLDDQLNQAASASPDGRSVVIVRQDRGRFEMALIEMASGKERLKFDFRSGISRTLAFSPDGRFLATPGPYPEGKSQRLPGVYIWDTGTGKELHHLDAGSFWHFAFSPDGKLLATAGINGTALLWDATRFRPDTTVPTPEGDALWSNLAADAPTAYQAVVALSRLGDRGVERLRPRLKPAEPIDPKRIAQLLTDLESPQFATRQKAASELAGYQDRVAKALEDRLKVSASAEARRQIQRLLEQLDGFLTNLEVLREVRAVEALARIDSPSSRRLLEELAKGAPDARLTREAQAVLTLRKAR